MHNSCLYLVLFSLAVVLTVAKFPPKKDLYDFKLLYKWKQIEFNFASEHERKEAIQNGTFNAGHLQPMDAQYTIDRISGKKRIFITIPRWNPTGYPATLGVITDKTRDGNPILEPYPSWSWQINPEQCNYHRIVSVFRVWADECNRLWVMDDGVVGSTFVCPPQILVFDLATDKMINKYEVPYDQYNNVSWYIALVAEIQSYECNCNDTWIYVADTTGPGLLVYSLKQNTSWRIEDQSFKSTPPYYNYTIAGDSFTLEDGMFTVALSPARDGPDKRKLRYHAMSDDKESWVYVKDLKNKDNFKVPNGSPKLFHSYSNRRDQQAATEVVDENGNVYFSLLENIELVKWDPNTPYDNNYFTVIADDKQTMQFPSGLKLPPYKGDEYKIWMFCTAFQRWAAGNLDPNEVNFRLFAAPMK